MHFFKEYLTKVFDHALVQTPDSIPRDYMLHHTVCDFAETVRWWLRNDKYSPEQIGEFYMATTPYF